MESTSRQLPTSLEKAMTKLALPAPLQEIQDWLVNQKSTSPVKKKNKKNSILFYGSKKSGKYTFATMIANQAGKELYKVDLSKLVSKYIGETEKNLKALFDLAKDKEWILFFDEADALFGKRTDVKDSHDRYANLEVSWLIQRMESHEGLIILSSNFKSNIDKAFIRRLQHVIHFPPP